MFVLTTIVDTVRIPPPLFAQPTLNAVNGEMDKKYPNRVIMDVGLVVCRYGDAALQIGDGVCVAGDGGAHHEVIVQLIVFRPFVNEVCLGKISASTEEGIRVSLGFFDDVFIPAYWMLRPSHYEKETKRWVWTPKYGEDEDDESEQQEQDVVKVEHNQEEEEEEENRFEMELGAEIRFKIKSINFTQVTNTAKGVQATTTTTSQSLSFPTASKDRASNANNSEVMDHPPRPVRKRSSSVDLSDSSKIPASMHIVASICEDGLGLTSWWKQSDDDDEEEEEEETNEPMEDAEQ